MPEELMTVQDYQWDDLDLAPETTGIYAWYLNPILRPADLMDIKSTKENLLRLAEQLKLPRFDVNAKGHLSLILKGNLEHEHLFTDNKEVVSQSVESILQDENKRGIFAKILRNAAPHLMAPLYIGVATNIRQRLRQHRQDINHFRSMRRLRAIESSLEDANQKFALEVVKRGIPNRNLRVFISSMTHEEDIDEETRKVVEAVETILNRLFYPIMGRR